MGEGRVLRAGRCRSKQQTMGAKLYTAACKWAAVICRPSLGAAQTRPCSWPTCTLYPPLHSRACRHVAPKVRGRNDVFVVASGSVRALSVDLPCMPGRHVPPRV